MRWAAAAACLLSFTSGPPMGAGEGEAMAFELTSSAFVPGQALPPRHTCDAQDLSPHLVWTDPPAGTASFALIVEDPDAPMGTWIHWAIYDIPPDSRGLPEGVAPLETLPDGARHGVNDFGRVGYGGPCPPPGNPHRYFFRLYALDSKIGLPPRVPKPQLLKAIHAHTLGEARLMGTYGR